MIRLRKLVGASKYIEIPKKTHTINKCKCCKFVILNFELNYTKNIYLNDYNNLKYGTTVKTRKSIR